MCDIAMGASQKMNVDEECKEEERQDATEQSPSNTMVVTMEAE